VELLVERQVIAEVADEHGTYIYWAMIIIMTRHLARKPQSAGPQVT
jgi:hypothetical protein